MSVAPHRRRREGHRGAGFTLIEVLVALAIASIGLAAVLAVVTNTARAAGGVRERTFAAWIAHNVIVEQRLGGTFPSVDRTTGDLEYAGQRWEWEQTVTQTPVPGIRRLDVRVRRAEAADDEFLANVTGFVGRTQMAAPPTSTDWEPSPQQLQQPGGGRPVVVPGITPDTNPVLPTPPPGAGSVR